MKHRTFLFAALAALVVPGTVSAGPASSSAPPSAFALGSVTFDPGAGSWLGIHVSPRLESIRYRPRRRAPVHYREHSGTGGNGFTQIHAGFFDPDGPLSRAFLLGMRAGSMVGENVQLGIGVDWSHRSDRQSEVVRDVPVPGGGTAQQSIVRAESSSELFPVMATIQITPAIDAPILPYFGAGGGYDVLLVSARDYDTHEKFNATYGGWGWQVWGGLALPLSGETKLTAEAFINKARVQRDVNDPVNGQVREIVNEDGGGLRGGLSWWF